MRAWPLLPVLAACHAAPATPAPPPAALPDVRHGHRVERLADGGLLAFGGFSDAAGRGDAGRQTFWLAPGAKEWQRRADMNVSRAFFASASVRGVVHAIGDGVERYDPARDCWEAVVAPGRLPKSHFAAAALGDTLYVLGGYPAERSGFFAVDLARGTVREAPPPPGFLAGDHFHFLVALCGELHVIGGLDSDSFAPRREHWVLDGDRWRALPEPPEGLWAKFAAWAVHGDELFLFGEFGGWSFDAREREWQPRAAPPQMLAMPAAIAATDAVWAVGGAVVEGDGARVLWRYDVASDEWNM